MVGHMDTTLAQAVAAEIRAEAGRQEVSRAELARRSGVPLPTLRRYFYAEEREPTIDAVAAVAAALDLPASELLARAEGVRRGKPRVKRVVGRRIRSAAPTPHRRG